MTPAAPAPLCRVSLARLLVLLCLVFTVMAGQATAQDSQCRLPSDLRELGRILVSAADAGPPLSEQSVAALVIQVQKYSENKILHDLSAAGLAALSTDVLQLLTIAEQLARGAALQNATALRDLVHDIDRQAMQACVAGTNALPVATGNGVSSGSGGDSPGPEGDSASGFVQSIVANPALGAGLIVALISTVTLVMSAIGAAFRWVSALVYNRKACWVPATILLKTGPVHGVDGLITTLGRGGCRFQPRDVGAVEAAVLALRQGPLSIEAGNHRLGVEMSALFDTYAHFRFTEPLTVAKQNDILRLSTITPHYVRRDRKSVQAQPVGFDF